MKGGVRHDITKRRVLKKKSELLRSYGLYTLSTCYILLGVWWLHRAFYPKEFQSEEEY